MARQSGKTLSQLQEDFLFPLFNCSSVLPPSAPPSPSMSSGLLCTQAEAAAGCFSRCSLGEPGEEEPCRKGTRVLGDPSCCSEFCSACAGCGKEGATELLLETSGQPQTCPTPGNDGGVAGMAALSFSSSWSPVWDSEVCSAWQAGEPLYFATKNVKVHEDGSLQSKYQKNL